MLELRNISAGYAGQRVLHNIHLSVAPGQCVSLIGANGAGKSTLVKTISGLLPISSGEIWFEGQRIHRLPPKARVAAGIAHVPEGRQVFAGLSVHDNLHLGGIIRRLGTDEPGFEERVRSVCRHFPVLLEREKDLAGNLSGGQQQMLAIARGLMSVPRLMMLDEPSLGLSPLLVTEIFRLIRSLRDEGLAILLAEQNARLSLAISDHGYVIESGHIVMEGRGADLANSASIAERYLGVSAPGQTDAAERRTRLASELSVFAHRMPATSRNNNQRALAASGQ